MADPPTPPLRFRTLTRRNEHYDDHKDDFDVRDEADYEQQASDFMTALLVKPPYLQCVQPFDHAVVRYNYVEQIIGIASKDGILLTFFKPDPQYHGMGTNRRYFDWECQRKR